MENISNVCIIIIISNFLAEESSDKNGLPVTRYYKFFWIICSILAPSPPMNGNIPPWWGAICNNRENAILIMCYFNLCIPLFGHVIDHWDLLLWGVCIWMSNIYQIILFPSSPYKKQNIMSLFNHVWLIKLFELKVFINKTWYKVGEWWGSVDNRAITLF